MNLIILPKNDYIKKYLIFKAEKRRREIEMPILSFFLFFRNAIILNVKKTTSTQKTKFLSFVLKRSILEEEEL